jgi:uncharacterized RDD family membrane protein YckC
VKLIAPGQELAADSVERFRREGRLASALTHPRCVFVYAADEDAGRPYIVMELMPGRTLADLARDRGPLPPDEAVAKILDVLDGLCEAHRFGVVHRDVKPSNCFLEADGRVKVGDFGLSKSLSGDLRVTGTGSFLGTPAYASPEQVRGEPAGPQSDVYSLAATLYFLLSGKAPFEGADAVSTLARIVSDPVPPLRSLRPELPASLDRAVLRGLERDRSRRWRDLDSFRQALVPFLPGGHDAAGLGIRLAAFVVDCVCISVVSFVSGLLIARATGRPVFDLSPESYEVQSLPHFLWGLTLWLVYLGVPEWLWGCTPGKWLMSLRVCTPTGTDPPPAGRVLRRTLVFVGLLLLGTISLYPWTSGLHYTSPEAQRQVLFLGLLLYPLEALGIALLLSTMRRRNGWRGLHEILSGTRVAQLAASVPQRTHGTSRLDEHLSHSDGLPPRVGPFRVRGALRWDEEHVLLGEDPALGRPVLLWLRPGTGDALGPERRDCTRPTRLRWLAAGEQEGWRWDAFPVVAGRPLAAFVAEHGPLPWAEFRPLLEQLTEELCAAGREGSLPAVLQIGQVWLRSGGGVLLLDTPLRREGATEDADAPAAAVSLVGQVTVLALEGQPRPRDGCVRAPLPEYAARLATRLLGDVNPYRDVEEFRAELAATRDRPAEVTRGRRAAQVVTMTALLGFGLCCCLIPGGVIGGPTGFTNLQIAAHHQEAGARVLQELEAGAAGELTAAVLTAPPLARPAGIPVACCQWAEDQQLGAHMREKLEEHGRELQDRIEGASWMNRSFYQWSEEFVARQPQPTTTGPARGSDFRAAAKEWADGSPSTASPVFTAIMGVFTLIQIALWPVLWAAWALAWRGGLTYRLTGLSLVCRDGRRAGRWRCAYRAALAWAPVALLLMAAVALESWHWGALTREERQAWVPVLSECLRWSGVALLLAYPAIAICFPRRGLHDRLSGTFVVPR